MFFPQAGSFLSDKIVAEAPAYELGFCAEAWVLWLDHLDSNLTNRVILTKLPFICKPQPVKKSPNKVSLSGDCED